MTTHYTASGEIDKWDRSDGAKLQYETVSVNRGLCLTITTASIVLLVLVVFMALMAMFAQPYNGLNSGVSWDWGGVELRGDPGIFVCSESPVAPLFPSLVTDC